jgi:hypothetical protein
MAPPSVDDSNHAVDEPAPDATEEPHHSNDGLPRYVKLLLALVVLVVLLVITLDLLVIFGSG